MLSQIGTTAATAQLASLWTAQRFNPANQGWAPTMEPLTEGPRVTGQADIAAGRAGAGFLVEGETVYVHGVNGGLAAVNTTTNEVNWRLNLGSEVIVPEILIGDRLVGRSGDAVYLIDTESGDIDNEHEIGYGTGLGWDGREAWLAPTSNGRLIAGETENLERRWETSLEGWAFRPAVDESTRHVLVATADEPSNGVDMRNPETLDTSGSLYAVRLDDGEILWEDSRPQSGICEPVIGDSQAFWAGADGAVRAYNTNTGDLTWEFTSDQTFLQTPAATREQVLLGTQSGQVISLNQASGEEAGRTELDGAVTAAPVIAGGVVFVGTAAETVHAIEIDTGDVLWDHETRDPVNSLTPISGGVLIETDVGYTILTATEGTSSESQDVSRRGLFSNGEDTTGAASDPVNLTTLGFLLSVVGIGYQLLQGR